MCSSRKCLFYSSLRCTCSVHVCLQELLCCTWTCLSPRACAAPWRWMGCTSLFLFLILLVCFETFFIVSVASIQVRNTGTNRKTKRNKPKQTEKMFFFSRNKPKNNQNRLSFRLCLFQPKIFFFRFEDTLAATLVGSEPMNPEPGERIQ